MENGMANLSVLKFDGPDTADRALLALEGMQQRQLITLLDAAVVSYPEGASKPRTRQLHSTTATGALGGMFWGMLLGLIFFVPLLGAAVGAATGALTGALTDIGIDDEFIRQTREKVTPDSSGAPRRCTPLPPSISRPYLRNGAISLPFPSYPRQNLVAIGGYQHRHAEPHASHSRYPQGRNDVEHHPGRQTRRLPVSEAQKVTFSPIGSECQADRITRPFAIILEQSSFLNYGQACLVTSLCSRARTHGVERCGQSMGAGLA
jgi:uncharacterized membrane protein